MSESFNDVVGVMVSVVVGAAFGAVVGAVVNAGEHPSKLSISRAGIQILTSSRVGTARSIMTSFIMNGDNC